MTQSYVNPQTITSDTELPAASALADGASNPTTSTLGASKLVFNGTTWDRYRTFFSQTITGITATSNGTAVVMTTSPKKNFAVQAKMQGDTSVFDVRLEGSVDNSNWTELGQITNATPGDATLSFIVNKPCFYVRYRVAVITRTTGTLDIKFVATD